VLGTLSSPLSAIPSDPGSYNADIRMIEGGAVSYSPYVYWGEYNSNTVTPVKGYAAPVVNNEICYSGSFSGSGCYNKIIQTGLTVNYGGGLVYSNLVRTEQEYGISTIGNGDSGGPALQLTADGMNILASGVISGMPSASASADTCRGVPGSAEPDGRKCSPSAFYASIMSFIWTYPSDAFVPTA
jgi:hypothetical protein